VDLSKLIFLMQLQYPLILGSASPRRKALLEQLGLTFRVQSTDITEESPKHLSPEEVPRYLARQKMEALQGEIDEKVILLTADTVVIHQGQLLRKPADNAEAVEMLQQLSGQQHKVVSGVCLSTPDNEETFIATTEIIFHELTEEEIQYYVERYSPYDKAGAYAIQEWIGMVGVQQIKGDYYNVVGLPVQTIWPFLKKYINYPA
jgi:septum formation protein